MARTKAIFIGDLGNCVPYNGMFFKKTVNMLRKMASVNSMQMVDDMRVVHKHPSRGAVLALIIMV